MFGYQSNANFLHFLLWMLFVIVIAVVIGIWEDKNAGGR